MYPILLLPPVASDLKLLVGIHTLRLNSVNGSVWTAALRR